MKIKSIDKFHVFFCYLSLVLFGFIGYQGLWYSVAPLRDNGTWLGFFLSVFYPLVILFTGYKQREFVKNHAKNALNLSLTYSIYYSFLITWFMTLEVLALEDLSQGLNLITLIELDFSMWALVIWILLLFPVLLIFANIFSSVLGKEKQSFFAIPLLKVEG